MLIIKTKKYYNITFVNMFNERIQINLFSLAEGSAGLTYEALAAGLLVITTEATGSVHRDGIEGFIIPERDSGALAARIEELLEDIER
ncbi:MAG: glycosyltransferase family 4 protein [Symploca sp. SIO2E9]|nr:glycosyltransferase family 4 protein [Symploca sp. SIO2E9]